MSDFQNYGSNPTVQVTTATPTGAGGLVLNSNFKTLADAITAANSAIASLQSAVTAAQSTLTAVQSSDAAKLAKSSNLSDVASAASARTNLGLGTAATHAAGDFDSAGAASTAQAASLQKTANLSDVNNAGTARANLGLGTAATHPSTDFQVAGTYYSSIGTANGLSASGSTISLATATELVAGAMSAADKIKLDSFYVTGVSLWIGGNCLNDGTGNATIQNTLYAGTLATVATTLTSGTQASGTLFYNSSSTSDGDSFTISDGSITVNFTFGMDLDTSSPIITDSNSLVSRASDCGGDLLAMLKNAVDKSGLGVTTELSGGGHTFGYDLYILCNVAGAIGNQNIAVSGGTVGATGMSGGIDGIAFQFRLIPQDYNTIGSPSLGMMAPNSDGTQLWFYNGSNWAMLG